MMQSWILLELSNSHLCKSEADDYLSLENDFFCKFNFKIHKNEWKYSIILISILIFWIVI